MVEILWLHLLLVCFPVVKVVEVGNNDGHRKSNGQHPGNGTQRPYYFSPHTNRPENGKWISGRIPTEETPYRSLKPIWLPISILRLMLTLGVSSFMDPKSSLKFHVTFLQSRMVKVKILSNSSKRKTKSMLHCYSQRKIPAGLNNNKNISMWDFSEKYFWLNQNWNI